MRRAAAAAAGRPSLTGATAAGASAPPTPVAARTLRLAGCRCCGLVRSTAVAVFDPRCPRCATVWHRLDPHSVQRTAAYLAAAAVLYVPANLLPVMSTTSVLGEASHTILGGIVELWQMGSYSLAVIVLVASIVVPLVKIAVLGLLAVTAQRRSRWRQLERARLYRLVDGVGHWSMLDVFVVVLLVGMVRFGVLASLRPEPGLLAFGAVVVLTLLASSSFDPKLIWPEDGDHD